ARCSAAWPKRSCACGAFRCSPSTERRGELRAAFAPYPSPDSRLLRSRRNRHRLTLFAGARGRTHARRLWSISRLQEATRTQLERPRLRACWASRRGAHARTLGSQRLPAASVRERLSRSDLLHPRHARFAAHFAA